MDACLLCLYVTLSCVGRGLCDGLITCPEESYRVSVRVITETPKGALCSKLGTKGKWMMNEFPFSGTRRFIVIWQMSALALSQLNSIQNFEPYLIKSLNVQAAFSGILCTSTFPIKFLRAFLTSLYSPRALSHLMWKLPKLWSAAIRRRFQKQMHCKKYTRHWINEETHPYLSVLKLTLLFDLNRKQAN
jgi:hypothetical protein